MHRAAFDFIDNVDGLSSASAVMAVVGAALKQLGIDHYIFSFVPTATESLADVQLVNRLPEGWLEAYTEQGFQADDPGFRYSQLTACPFRWLKEAPYDPENRRVAELLQFNRDFGIVDGFVIPVLSPIARLGQVWLGGAEIDLPARALPALHLMSLTAFNRVLQIKGVPSTVTTLTAREREVLTRAAVGESADQIARALNLSTPTVVLHLKNCRKKLGAKNITQAVAIALGHRMLRP
ncbi:LuxR family quorum sensing-dependent transcriptional regulator [Bradyrhizobium japonicum]